MYRKCVYGNKNKSFYNAILIIIIVLFVLISCSKKDEIEQSDIYQMTWQEIEKKAEGRFVYFSAWAGSEQINQYIQWVMMELMQKHRIMLQHIPNNGGIEAVQVLQREKVTNKKVSGLDLMWINGAAFRVGREEDLFSAQIYDLLPHVKYIDVNNQTLFEDFTIATDGYEVPWGTAQLIYFLRADIIYNNNEVVLQPITSYEDFFDVIKKNKGRFTYPQPPDFTGLAFIKSLFYTFSDENTRSAYYRPYSEQDVADRNLIVNNTIWKLLHKVHPYLWRNGKTFPKNYADLERMYKDGEVNFGMTFNPFTPYSNVELGIYPKDTVTFLPKQGSIANAHFLAIPQNSASKEAALVVINFLLSPEAQARKNDIKFWGDPTVLDLTLLDDTQVALFSSDFPINILGSEMTASPPQNTGENTIREFHATWEKAIEKQWTKEFLK